MQMKEKAIQIEEKKKPYQKPELVVHGSVEKITEQTLINREGFRKNADPVSQTV
jgi:hypothetical protein